jgi:hypothetical protein
MVTPCSRIFLKLQDQPRKALVPLLDEVLLTRLASTAVLTNATNSLKQLLGL